MMLEVLGVLGMLGIGDEYQQKVKGGRVSDIHSHLKLRLRSRWNYLNQDRVFLCRGFVYGLEMHKKGALYIA